MNHLLKKIQPNKQNGYGLIELILGLALTGILATGFATFAWQSINVTDDTKDRMNALMQVENAGYWVSRDIQMSVNFTLGDNAGFPLQLRWQDMDHNDYEAIYSLSENGISRNLTKNEESPVHTLIAQNIDTAASSTNVSATGGLFIFNIASTSGGIEVSRTYKIKPRLYLNS